MLDGIPAGSGGASIDHVVIGPGGVFTVRDRAGHVRLTARSITVDGEPTDDLPAAVADARRIERFLTRAVGYLVHAKPVVSLLVGEFELVESPDEVAVVPADGLSAWLADRPGALTSREVEDLVTATSRVTTWADRRSR